MPHAQRNPLIVLTGFAIVLLSILSSLLWTQAAMGALDDPPKFPVDIASLDCVLKDSMGNPIAGATSYVYAMRCTQERGSHYGWPRDNIGNEQNATSNGEGEIKLRYPVKFGAPEKWLNTCQISLMLLHPNFVPQTLHIDLDKAPTQIVMTEGCEASLTAVDSHGKPIDKFFPLVAGEARGTRWEVDEERAHTKGLPAGNLSCLLVSPNEQGTLFSQLVELETSKENAVVQKGIVMKPGKRITGQLPDYVERPVADGTVHINAMLDTGKPLGGVEPVTWEAWCDIRADGTFELPSIPAPAQMQVIAICQGWVIESLDNDFFVKGKTFDVPAEGADFEVKFEMKKTGSIDIELMGTDGESIQGARVSTWPNQQMLSGGSTILASKRQSITQIEMSLRGDWSWAERENTPNRFYQISDEEGRVLLRDIPAGVQQSIHVEHDEYVMPFQIGETDNRLDYTVQAGETQEKLIILEKRTQPKKDE